MQRNHERGIAIVLSLFLMSAMSVLAASLMFLAQTETYASMNYRMMSQARYAGEAGIQKASDFLLDNGPSGQYAVPGSVADPLTNYDRTKSPVLCAAGSSDCTPGEPIVLSAVASVPSNYPAPAVQTAFSAAAQGTLPAGNATVSYGAYATLVSMQRFESYGGGDSVVQTWEITGIGETGGARTATVEVFAMVETPKVPASSFAAFASATGCGALTFSGNVETDSYDSSTGGLVGATEPDMSGTGGDVATNGNLSLDGSTDVNGNLYTPRTGVGSCEEGAVTALTEGGGAAVHGSVVQLPASVSYPIPELPTAWQDPVVSAPLKANSINITSANVAGACALFATYGVDALDCSVSGTGVGSIITIKNGANLPNISMSNQIVFELVAGNPAVEYNFNSISLDGNASIRAQATANTENVVVNVAGKNPDDSDMAVPIDFTGGTFASPDCATCSNYDASIFQIVYGGTGEVKMTGNNDAAAVLYAPDAEVTLSGSADFYGSMLGRTIDNTGGAGFYYDRRLQRDFYVKGHPMASTFTWKRY